MKYIFLILIFTSSAWGQGTYLVTCAASGFGSDIIKSLQGIGKEVVMTGRTLENIKDPGKKLLLDFSKREHLQPLVDNIANNSLDGLVLIPSRPHFYANKSIPEYNDWQKAIQEAYLVPFELIRLLVPKFKEGASIVIISGLSSKMYLHDAPNVNIIRLMWSGTIKNLSWQLASNKIRVNAVSPTLILTDYHQKRLKQRAEQAGLSVEQKHEAETQNIPLRRYGETKEVTSLVTFLLSDKASYINGENIAIDGGQNASY